MPRKRRARWKRGKGSGLDISGALGNVMWVLIGLVIGVPVLLAIFSTTGEDNLEDQGAFEGLTNLPTSGVLATNQYSGILVAIILLIPLAVVVGFVMTYIDNRNQERRDKAVKQGKMTFTERWESMSPLTPTIQHKVRHYRKVKK